MKNPTLCLSFFLQCLTNLMENCFLKPNWFFPQYKWSFHCTSLHPLYALLLQDGDGRIPPLSSLLQAQTSSWHIICCSPCPHEALTEVPAECPCVSCGLTAPALQCSFLLPVFILHCCQECQLPQTPQTLLAATPEEGVMEAFLWEGDVHTRQTIILSWVCIFMHLTFFQVINILTS